MPVRFVLAPAGGGKTQYLIDEIARGERRPRQERRPAYLLVPQQATFIHERLLAEASEAGGFCRAKVCSFARLVVYAMKEQGMEPAPQLSEAGKLLLAGRVLSEAKERLHIYGGAAGGAGLSAYLVKAAEELANYGVAPDDLAAAVERLALQSGETRQVQRLRETALLYRDYAAGAAEGYAGYAANMAYLAGRIKAGYLAEAAIYLDGYADFTPAEEQVLAAFFATDARITIALPIDPALLDGPPLANHVFAQPLAVWQRLCRLAETRGAALEPPVLLSGEHGRFAENPELAALEASLAGRRRQPLPQQPQHIFLGRAEDMRAELEGIGRRIIRLTREQGLRYRDISIITRDTAPYEQLLTEVFDGLGIPFFVDSKKPLLCHPLFELLRSALETMAYRPTYERIMRFCKNILIPLAAEEKDSLDNYALAHGLRFWHWLSERPWDFPLLPDEEPELAAYMDNLRQRACGPLLDELRRLPRQLSSRELNRILLAVLERLQVREALRQLAEQARQQGRAEDAEQHNQAWDKLTDFLREAGELLGEQTFTLSQLLKLYDAALAGLTVSTIPPGIDQVFVSSLERSRSPRIKAAFVPTVNEGILPRKVVLDGLFSDEDRRQLRSCGAALAPDTLQRQFAEDYLCYIALTRACGQLYLSFVGEDSQGQPLKPSPLLRRIKSLFPALQTEPYEPLTADLLVGGELDLARMAGQLSAAGEGRITEDFWQAVYAYYAAEPRYQQALAQMQNGLGYQPVRRISENRLSRLYGQTLRSSVSRLERFRLCPFSYFAGYGLKLKPRRLYELDPASRGQLIHEVLAEVGDLVRDQGLSWPAIDEQIAAALVDEALEKHLPRLLAGILRSSARYQYLARRIRNTLIFAVLMLAEHTRAGEFIPVAWELPFGSGEPGSLPAFRIELGQGRALELSGRIDRVDMALDTEQNKAYFRVVDYKSGALNLKPEDIYAGLRLQLLLYLQVVLANAGLFSAAEPLAAGLYYSRVSDNLTPGPRSGAEKRSGLQLSGLTVRDERAIRLADREISGKSRLIPAGLSQKGIHVLPAGLSSEQLQALQERVYTVLRDTAEQLFAGMIHVSPLRDLGFDACEFCEFAAVCGFDRELVQPRRKERASQAGASQDEPEEADEKGRGCYD
ncbi:MAG: hypothetical protein GX572_03075 [Clostridia bacterium]|nr:hypothetical protein [Clostridia bacterium]